METQRTVVRFVIERPENELWIKWKWLYQLHRKRVKVVSAVLESPSTWQILVSKGVVSSEEERKKAEMHDAMLKDAGSLLSEVKQSHSNDSRAAVQMGLSLICGETVTGNRLQASVAKSLGINQRRIAMNAIHRMQVLCNKINWLVASEMAKKERHYFGGAFKTCLWLLGESRNFETYRK